ncbi:MAG: type IX secretion system membrane protein PorP/SprF [Lewinellaceae bacterium]|nr:type IX secretion system membrane protein PorP/SprF [Lewinellaceae bacterium]
MRTWIFLLGLSLFSLPSLFGQQAAQYTLYMLNPMQFHPGYAGLDYSLSATGGIRRQWVNLEGSPNSQFVNVHMPLAIAKGAVGLKLENDLFGAERATRAMFVYAYHLELGNSGILSLGVGAGLQQHRLDGQQLRTPDGNYEGGLIDHRDGILPLGIASGQALTFEAGVFFKNEKWESGLSVRHLNEPLLTLEALSIQLKRSIFYSLGYSLEINSDLSLHPSLMVRSDLQQTQADASLILKYNNNIFGGASFRGYNANSIDAVGFLAGFKLNENLTLGYAYDMTLSDLRNVSDGSHEIILNYNLNKLIGMGRPPRIIYNPRSL